MRKMAVVLLVLLGGALPAQAAEQPREVIAHFYDGLLATMKEAKQLGFQGRFDKLKPLVEQTFDMPDMTRRSLGYAAKSLTPEQLAELTKAFRRYTVASYASNFDGYDGERFDVKTSRPESTGKVLVPTTLVPGDGSAPVELDYVMHETAAGWRITDVLAEGSVSEVARRRSEFVSVLRNSGFKGLLDAIDRKTAALGGKS